MTYLLDTDVISELRKRDPDPRVLAWYSRVTSADVFVSVLTIGEIRLGIERLRMKVGAGPNSWSAGSTDCTTPMETTSSTWTPPSPRNGGDSILTIRFPSSMDC